MKVKKTVTFNFSEEDMNKIIDWKYITLNWLNMLDEIEADDECDVKKNRIFQQIGDTINALNESVNDLLNFIVDNDLDITED